MYQNSRSVSIAPVFIRSYSSSTEPNLKSTLQEVIPAKRELFKKVKRHADKKIGDIKVENTLGGMRYHRLLARTRMSL